MTTPAATTPLKASALTVFALALVAAGIYVAFGDDPAATGLGPAAAGMVLMILGVVVGVRTTRNLLPPWARRAALAAGVVTAVGVALLIHGVAVAVPLFAAAPAVPSTAGPVPPPPFASAAESARSAVRAAVLEQNLPGVSVAVGAGGSLVWAEGFGWRDVVTRTPMTARTRFNIGSAARTLTPAAATSLGLGDSGTDTAADWSPSHLGEPEDDFPLFTGIRRLVFEPLGLAVPEYPLPGERATFYVPRTSNDPSRGRHLMYMRDLACCAGNMAFSSTPSDVVRLALATNAGDVNGELAGGTVMSLVTRRDKGIVVAVAANVAYADTAGIAGNVADAFAAAR